MTRASTVTVADARDARDARDDCDGITFLRLNKKVPIRGAYAFDARDARAFFPP